MSLSALAIPLTSGLMDGVLLFLIASGLTLLFGVLKLLNFAHGGLFMLGAFFGYSLALGHVFGTAAFVAAVLAAAVLTGVVGLVIERAVFQRLYAGTEMQALLGTYAVLLMLEGAAQLAWGVDPVSEPMPVNLSGAIFMGQVAVPQYALLLLALTVAVLAALEWTLRATRFGRHLRAVAEDRQMATLLGINSVWIARATVFAGTVLAGLGGALAAPTMALVPDVAGSFIIQAFAVVIIGGLGSIYGALIAALLAGVLNSFAAAYAPALSGYTLYALMVAVLVLRPQGLFGSAPEAEY